ncbi:TPA: serine/threonine protein phosphatase [Salmonella enterica]|uniref:serine/threonine protein phosphatase n=1 Tax=Salmonella TaxID=590 RepID=UPI0004073D7E|nr:serine/threonine protein phosphatase [Salmonella enterica]MDV2049507.1 serine/threonine protein phosphatase [Salmonella enterica subsp. enterica serovar Shamba]MDV2052338.1 serine/threonine protein phosphatase [Salmonella enterica subsp. enterica serovar Uzaramo]MDV2066089.1 serine/threonine protein phosphatase [Salmonella enterica subsp. enterica serovar Shamba]MDV2071927.1 serine/threonine protein phosphatase [Salmonella enterica subsp. enterica serovar Uzaramo]MDV2074019.1 serine/threoni
MLLRRENIEREQAIVSSSLRQGITLPWRSQLYFIAIITKYLLATDEIRYLQQRTLTKQKNLHTLSFYICPG